MVTDWEQAYRDLREKYEYERKLAMRLEVMLEQKILRINALEARIKQEIEGNISWCTCLHCGESFGVLNGHGRKKYCSNACKQAEYRYRVLEKKALLR